MKRKGLHRPTIEDTIEISGIEMLHPGGMALTRRTAELAELKEGVAVLDVSCGRGTQSVFYAKEYGAVVTGIDISADMLQTAAENAKQAGIQVTFKQGDSQNLPFDDNCFDVVINECAVGIPDDSQKVLDEMVRVVKPGGKVLIHESTWREKLPEEEREEITERYGTTPLELHQWLEMLENAGAKNIYYELEQWSTPEMFWKIRKDRDVKHWRFTMSPLEKIRTGFRVIKKFGIKGLFKMMQNGRVFFNTIRAEKLGYCLFKGEK